VKVSGDIITLNQFADLVELVNQVSDALEGAVDIEDFQKLGFVDDESSDIGDLADDISQLDGPEKYKWLFDALIKPDEDGTV